MSYEASLKQKRDWESVLATVRRAGLTLGRKEGIQEGIEKERARAEAVRLAEKRDFIKNLVVRGDYSDEEIADIAAVTLSLVEDVRKEINK